MNRVKTLTLTILALLACAAFMSAQAQMLPRVYIASGGADGTGCGTLTSPCRYLSYSVANRVTTGGEVIILDSGTYDQSGVTISKAVTVSAPTGINAGFKGTTGAAITVAVGSTEAVVLRGLNITGGDSGIEYSSGAAVHIENCLINRADSYGIYATAAGKLFVKDSEVRNVTAYFNSSGIMLLPSSGTLTAVFDRTRVENCLSAGVYVSDGVKAFVRNSVISGAGTGLWADPQATAAELTVDQCQIINNTTGIQASGAVASGSDVRVTNTTVERNATGLTATSSGRILTRTDSFGGSKTNTVEANTTNGSFSITTLTAQ